MTTAMPPLYGATFASHEFPPPSCLQTSVCCHVYLFSTGVYRYFRSSTREFVNLFSRHGVVCAQIEQRLRGCMINQAKQHVVPGSTVLRNVVCDRRYYRARRLRGIVSRDDYLHSRLRDSDALSVGRYKQLPQDARSMTRNHLFANIAPVRIRLPHILCGITEWNFFSDGCLILRTVSQLFVII